MRRYNSELPGQVSQQGPGNHDRSKFIVFGDAGGNAERTARLWRWLPNREAKNKKHLGDVMKDNGTGSGPIVSSEPNRPLLGSGESQHTMLLSIGQRLREVYPAEPSDTLPEPLRGLLDKLRAVAPGPDGRRAGRA